MINIEKKQREQEPVGVVCWHEGIVMGVIFPTENMPKEDTKLYTTPPESDKLIKKLTATIAELQNENLKQYKYTSELQAHINVLREALEKIVGHDMACSVIAKQALDTTLK